VYEAIDIFVFPSLFEGLGTSLLAAMSYAVPSITFFGCALGEIVEDGVSGIQVEARDSDGIRRAATRVLRDREFAKRLGRAGRTQVEEKFSAEKMVQDTLTIYDQLICKA
jgi:glycosyltransferase involved in cell wall biosynthesis